MGRAGTQWVLELMPVHCHVCGWPRASAGHLVGEAGFQILWLQGPGCPVASDGTLVCVAGSWVLLWKGMCAGVAVASGDLKAALLLVGGAVSLHG